MSLASKLAAALVGGLAVVSMTWPSATLAGSIPTGKPEDVGMSSERLARIGPAMQRHIDAGEIAGVVTLVARRGRIVHFEAHGYADMRNARRCAPTTFSAWRHRRSRSRPSRS